MLNSAKIMPRQHNFVFLSVTSPFILGQSSIIMLFDAFENHFLKIWKMEHLPLRANAPFSIKFSKVFKTLLNYFFLIYLKIENDVMI